MQVGGTRGRDIIGTVATPQGIPDARKRIPRRGLLKYALRRIHKKKLRKPFLSEWEPLASG